MILFNIKKRPKLSIVVVFYNMRREAKRTLLSLTTTYQKNITASEYEVIAVDSNSTEPLNGEWVESIQRNFRYRYVKTEWPSPCHAMNTGIQMARSEYVVCMIDGARILSPGILSNMILMNSLFKSPLTQTIAMHIGNEAQMVSVEKGYNQTVEDELVGSIDWLNDGYSLFDISCLASSGRKGYLFPINESNCFCVPKRKLTKIGGFDEDFKTPGGGIVNHDTLEKLLSDQAMTPVMLLGEASFHQFHGGVATNVPKAKHPINMFYAEYIELRGKPYKPASRELFYFGNLPKNTRRFVLSEKEVYASQKARKKSKGNSTVICILGMHRSGTSCLTGCLQNFGLYLGEVNNSAPHNHKGNKENLAMRAINDQVLLNSGGSWDHPPKQLSWNEELGRSRDQLIATYSEYNQWGFKDPRTILTLPFWLDALPNLKFIGTFRHPIAVARSLRKRRGNSFSIEAGLDLWQKYNEMFLEYYDIYNFPLVCFDWPADIYTQAITAIANDMGLNSTAKKTVISFYDEILLHQDFTDIEQGLSDDVLSIYEKLHSRAKR